MRKALLVITLFFGFNAFALNKYDCKVNDPVWNSVLSVQNSSILTANVKAEGRAQISLVSSNQVCGYTVDFTKHCTLTAESQPNYVSYSAECFENKDPNGRWFATFDFSFYRTTGTGLSHCRTSLGEAESYELTECQEAAN